MPGPLTELGQALASGSRDMMQLRLRDQEEADRRAEKLSDLADARQYAQGLTTDQRQYAQGQQELQRRLMMQDETRHQKQRVDEETYQLLLKEGWLKPVDAQNPDAIAKAADARQKHMDRVMAEQESNRGNAAARAAQLATARDQVQQKVSELTSVLSEPEPEPDRATVIKRAVELASVGLKNGEKPSNDAIAQQIEVATNEIAQRQNQAWYRRKNDAAIQLQGYRAQLGDISAEANTLANRFGTVGVAAPQAALAAPVSAAPTAAGSPVDFISQIKAAIAKERPDLAPPTAAPSPLVDPSFSPLDNPTGNTLVQSENDRRSQLQKTAQLAQAAQQQATLSDPYNESLDKLAAVQARIKQASTGAPISPTDLFQMGESAPIDVNNPSAQASLMSRLLMQEQALTRSANERKRAMLGLNPAQVLANPVSSAHGPSTYTFGASSPARALSFDDSVLRKSGVFQQTESYPPVPAYGGGMRDMTDTEKSAYDIGKQADKTGGFLFKGF